MQPEWIDVGASEELGRKLVQQVSIGRARIALTCQDGQFGAISGVCNHVGGPLGEGTLDGDSLGPSRPTISPAATLKLTSVTAVSAP